ANLTIDPNWSTFHPGESVTFTCDMNEGKDTDWEYEIRRNGEQFIQSDQHKSYTLQPIQIDHSGEYQCSGVRKSFSLTKCSGTVSLNVTAAQPKAKLTAGPTTIPVGGSVTLSCSVEPSAGWKYRWWRRTSDTPEVQLTDENRDINVKQGGIYRCVGERGNTNFQSLVSDDVIITITLTSAQPRAKLTAGPTTIPVGGSVTLNCSVEPSAGWKYRWWRRTSDTPEVQFTDEENRDINVKQGGIYRCVGVREECQEIQINTVCTLDVEEKSDELVPVLSVSPSWLSPGASVTLSCDVEEPSARWRFFWYKAVPDPSSSSYSYELLPGSINGTKENSYNIHGQTNTTGYVCEAGRGEQAVKSKPKFVWSAEFHPGSSLKVNPDRVQHFSSDSVSFHCEGNSADWRLMRVSETGQPSFLNSSNWGTRKQSIISNWSDGGIFWCESGLGEFSNAVNITLQSINNGNVIIS
uniref:Ig-like domain-containing protein n=1 Tax=Poecilia formosa TaxID=48698 RepID=A0A096M5R3_POEFO